MAHRPEGMPVGSSISYRNERFPFELFSERACQNNHSQSPRRLAERGGLSWSEAAAIIENRRFHKMDQAEAEAVVRAAAAGIEARRAATGTGAVHESPVGNAEPPTP